jgi:hypothetical protein
MTRHTLLRALACLLVAAALLPAPIAAGGGTQFFDWGQQCMPTLPQACMSISLRVEYPASLESFGGNPATTFQLWLQNTTGGPFGFRNFRVYNAAYTPEPHGYESLLSQDPCYGCSEHDLGGADTEDRGHWSITGFPAGTSSFGTSTFAFSRHFYEPIMGCDVPESVTFLTATTCDGLVRVDDFFLPGRWEIISESRFRINGGDYHSAGVTDDAGIVWNWDPVDCYIGETCVPVPEPGALPLLATGLALVGLVGWRRRFS